MSEAFRPARALWLCSVALWLCSVALGLACASPLDQGERRYHEGDRLGALDAWRAIEPGAPGYEAAQARIARIEEEFDQLVVRYKKRARYYEQRDRLAESVLNYRLALQLQPDDEQTLEHVQQLVRELERRKQQGRARFEEAFANGDLPASRLALAELRSVDPFDPQLAIAELRLDEALREQVEALLAEGRRGFTSGDHAHAAEAFGALLELDPENEAARGYLAYIASIRAGELEGARAQSGRPSERQVRAEGLYRNALLAEQRGRPFSAIQLDRRALALDPNHRGAARHLASLRRGLADQVEPLIESGREHYQQEELESALDDWRRALLIEPENLRAREYVARAQQLLQNLEQLRSDPRGDVGAR